MKNLLLILFVLTGLSAYPQANPPVADSWKTKAAFAFADSVFHGDAFDFGITVFDFPPDIRDILLKFNNAISANKEWFSAYSSRLQHGDILPYDEKFGITREEYDKIKSMDKVHPALKVVSTQRVTVVRQDNKIGFKGDAEGQLLSFLEFDLGRQVLTYAGDTIPFAPAVHTTTAMAYGLIDSYTWRLEKIDTSQGLQADQLTAKMVEIELGLHHPDNKLLLRILYQSVSHGVSTASLDLAGFIQTGTH